MNSTRVSLPDGLQLAVIEAGPREAPSLVFVHGIAQSKQAFARVLAGPLARSFRLVAFDLRGHGDSDVPAAADPLGRAQLADDLAAVIGGLGLVRPWVAAWSFGGVVVGEYLRRSGDAALGGVIFLAGAVRSGREAAALFGPGMMNHARALLSEDPAVYAAAARAFLEGATHLPLDPAALEAAVSEMLRVPARVRRALLAGGEDFTPEVAAARVPVATLHGELDQVVLPAMSDLIGTVHPGAAAIRLPGVGHLPWLEAPEAFDAALAGLLPAR
jgi:pimeloyl-ACP methyl ester carboxylesterase